MIRVCEYCHKEFEHKRATKFCSRNCRTKDAYHKKHPDAVKYVKGRSAEERKEIARAYQKNKYDSDKEYKEYMKMKRKEYYKKEGR